MIKKAASLFLILLLIVGCSDNSDDDMMLITNMEGSTTIDDASVFVKGDFVSLAHPTSGVASINVEKTALTFKNFKTDNGPKLLVYLTTDADATDYVELGSLKGISGDYTYNIPENIDLKKYKLVNIWCVDFSVSFGVAELK